MNVKIKKGKFVNKIEFIKTEILSRFYLKGGKKNSQQTEILKKFCFLKKSFKMFFFISLESERNLRTSEQSANSEVR